MSIAVLLVLLAPFFYAVANVVDKLQVHGNEEDSEPGALMALGSVVGLFFIIPLGAFIYFTGRSVGGWEIIIPLIFNEIIYNVAIWIYMTLLKGWNKGKSNEVPPEDLSKVVPWFQSIPAFGLVLAFFVLGEKISLIGILAIIALIIGGLVLSYSKGKIRKIFMFMMILCCILYAVYDVIFAEYARDIDPVSAIFIAICGKSLWSLPILVGKKERQGFLLAVKTRLLLQSLGEVTNLIADTVMHVCLIMFPVAIVQGVCCTQPFFILFMVVILTKYYNRAKVKAVGDVVATARIAMIHEALTEDIKGLTLTQKLVGITFMVIGGILVSI